MIEASCAVEQADDGRLASIVTALDARRGVVLSSGVDYPGRYSRWDIAFVDPPLLVEAQSERVRIAALNDRGQVPLAAFRRVLAGLPDVVITADGATEVRADVQRPMGGELSEELRTRRTSTFSILRALIAALPGEGCEHLGLYGAFGYDLVRQIEDLPLPDGRPDDVRDFVLYLPDQILAVDHAREVAELFSYEFTHAGASTGGLPRTPVPDPFQPAPPDAQPSRDHAPGEYAALVEVAKEEFRAGNLFEVVPGQSFKHPVHAVPSAVFEHLKRSNPAPFGAFMNLGGNEFLISASPEMYVRVTGSRVETCPISGTIARGADALEDAEQILQLLSSEKDRAELTMCTDVDRNDKSRICEPGSVRVVGRRQVEMYSRLIHTVDHVEGILRPGFDGLDAFATHMWAVTVTGAPKLWAMRFIDEHERSPRRWYGGAIGALLANGDVNTGLTLRTITLREGFAEVRAGATLLIDSVPDDEERETQLKASALIDALSAVEAGASPAAGPAVLGSELRPGQPCRVLLLDHEDSFVHTLAGYFRAAGAEVLTVRVPRGGLGREISRQVERFRPDFAVLSPGPGRPEDFDAAGTLKQLLDAQLPLFGVCLGHQAIGEYFGAPLRTLAEPLHGKARLSRLVEPGFLAGLPGEFEAGRYHSLHLRDDELPAELQVVAVDDDGVVMAMQHRELPVYSVQFHPESLMTTREDVGMRIVRQVIEAALSQRPS